VAQLEDLNEQLAAREEQLKAVAKECSSVPTKDRDQKALSAKIAALRIKIAQLSPAESQPTAPTNPVAQGSNARARPSFAVVQLELAREGDLGTRANLRA
jgi:hypothetical protein